MESSSSPRITGDLHLAGTDLPQCPRLAHWHLYGIHRGEAFEKRNSRKERGSFLQFSAMNTEVGEASEFPKPVQVCEGLHSEGQKPQPPRRPEIRAGLTSVAALEAAALGRNSAVPPFPPVMKI